MTGFMRDEVNDQILTNIDDYVDDGSTFDQFYEDEFNSDGICNRALAEKRLTKFNEDGYKCTFGAVRYVRDWEKENFGQINTDDLTDPERTYNMLDAIFGRRGLQDALSDAGLDFDSKMSEENVQAVKDVLTENERD